ncbi:uncharacterized protein LOC119551035 [Drosophila subpulchrella]|uniref:uncharacterized protein LOC119551035 n=1 Tax=Drosophila subpulchrella TaxID=1486046 RepID=UPI0018A16CB4|nr:uncharacterized protein LOC119551035 [Drosophila subpulchrella]
MGQRVRHKIPGGRITGELRVRNGNGQRGAEPTHTHMMMAMPAPTSLLIDSSISNPLTSANIYTIYSKTEEEENLSCAARYASKDVRFGNSQIPDIYHRESQSELEPERRRQLRLTRVPHVQLKCQ